jgi:hypothetical protein
MNTVAASLPQSATTAPLPSWFARTRAAVWRAVELSAWARAQGHLLQFADRCEELQPELAKELRAAARSGPMV